MMKILMIDNYDSFTYNLVQYLMELGADLMVMRNDQVTAEEIVESIKPDALVISPGPGRPEKAGNCLDIVRCCHREFPILGVCLGHQAIGQAFGGRITYAPTLMHGKVSKINHNGHKLFFDVPKSFAATRYHSLIVNRETLPDTFNILAETDDDLIMAMKYKRFPTYGIQFHPESIMTPEGKKILANFLDLAGSSIKRRLHQIAR